MKINTITFEEARKKIEAKLGKDRNYFIYVKRFSGGDFLFVHNGGTGMEYVTDAGLTHFYMEEGYVYGADAREKMSKAA